MKKTQSNFFAPISGSTRNGTADDENLAPRKQKDSYVLNCFSASTVILTCYGQNQITS